MAIRTFKSKWLEVSFVKGCYKGVSQKEFAKIARLLDLLEDSASMRDISVVPGYHPLKGDRKGTHSLKVTGNYRLTFRFEGGDALDVDYEDYH